MVSSSVDNNIERIYQTNHIHLKMGLSSVERFGGSCSTSVSSASQSTLSTSCHNSSTGGMSSVGAGCQCKGENLFAAPQNGQKKLKLFKKIKLRMGLGN